jgi:POT family
VREAFSREGRAAIGRLFVIYLFVAVCSALWYQTGIEWTLQAEHLDLNFLGLKLLPAQVDDASPLLILAFIPLFNYLVYPAISRVFPLTPLRKISIGFFLTAASFVVVWWIQAQVATGLNMLISPEQLTAYGWRIPFLLGGAFGLMSMYLRDLLIETPVFEELRKRRALSAETPLRAVVRNYRAAIVLSGLLTWILSGVLGFTRGRQDRILNNEIAFLHQSFVRFQLLSIVAHGANSKSNRRKPTVRPPPREKTQTVPSLVLGRP